MTIGKFPYWARLALAVILAPTLGDVVTMLIYTAWEPNIWDMFVIGLMFAYPTTIFLGLPFHFALKFYNKQHFAFYLIGGFLIGVAVLTVFLSAYNFPAIVFLYAGLPGSITAVIARWIVGGNNPPHIE
jgi:hypothetical protein